MDDPNPDLARSRAVLIGTGDYTHLPPVPAAINSLDRMAQVLTSDLCGWPEDRVSMVADRRSLGDLPDRLTQLFHDAEKVALFYFVGHGQIASSPTGDTLCLGLVDSRQEPARRKPTSLPFDAVADALWHSPAETKIVILDCCYAGLAGRLGGPDVLDLTRSTGAYTLAASGEFAPAWYETDERAPRPQTFFTKYLADVIESGILGEEHDLRLGSIFHQAAVNLLADGKPEPTSRAVGHAPRIVFARNNAYVRRRRRGAPGLTISQAVYTQLVAHARADYPQQACGIVAGPFGSDRPERVTPMTNKAASSEFYEMDEFELLKAYREMERRDEDLVIVYHSRHSGQGAYLSRLDIQYSTENENQHTVIIDIDDDGEVEIRSHRITSTYVIEEDIHVVARYDA